MKCVPVFKIQMPGRLCRTANLRAHFGGISSVNRPAWACTNSSTAVCTPAEKKPSLLAALQKIPGLNVVAQPDPKPVSTEPGRQTRLEIVGSDRPGIVHEITSALARAGVNVEEFSSEVVSAPMSGETLFKASARLGLPEGCNLAALKKNLEKIAADLLVDVSFAELDKR